MVEVGEGLAFFLVAAVIGASCVACEVAKTSIPDGAECNQTCEPYAVARVTGHLCECRRGEP